MATVAMIAGDTDAQGEGGFHVVRITARPDTVRLDHFC